MNRVRREKAGVAAPSQEELPLEDAQEDPEAMQEAASHGVDMDDDFENLNENPDTRGEDETVQQAGDRIEAKYKARATSPLRAIRAFCVICVGCYPREVAKCTATGCALHPFRYGTNPYQKRAPK